MRKQHEEKQLTHEEIQQAMQNFLAKGKSIKILAPQEIYQHDYVGGYNWGPYESMDSLDFNTLS
ncbi:MAG: hypothetical protein HQM11_17110 [SAR324 cluster bacterium]|nr:hypothetical protein [SAR324 cluster bacterium]